MALTITKLKMWKDPHYTRGCLEVPPVGSKKLPTPDYSSTDNLRPRKGSTLTSLELPLCYSQVFDMSYLYIEAEDPSGTIRLFGWIDSVELIATSADAVRIDWSVDWWRSYSGLASFGAGRLMRCNDSARRRPVSIQPRYRTAANLADIKSDDGLLWVIISYRKDSARRIAIYPVDPDNPTFEYRLYVGQFIEGGGIDNATAPSLLKTMSGSLPKLLGLTSNSIDGAWISPINPLPNDNTWILLSSSLQCLYQKYSIVKGQAYNNVTYGAIDYVGYTTPTTTTPLELTVPPYKRITITTEAKATDDITTYAITDNYGNICGSSPYGLWFDRLFCTLDIGYVGSSLKITFSQGADMALDTTEGQTVTLSLPSVPISSSAYSDYVYSGQRDYEMQLTSLQNEKTAVNGLSGAIGGAVMGGVLGSIIPGAGTAAGAIAGAAAGGISQIGSAGINYAVDEFIYKDKFQDLEDKKYANQTGNLMIPGDGYGWILFSKFPRLVSLTADNTFRSEFTQHVAQEGYPCDSPVASTRDFIMTGGPLQIRNLIVTGEIPPVAKRTIKSLLETGIRIVENNTEGEEP